MAGSLVVVGGAGGAADDRLITGKQIKDGTITTTDVKDKTLVAADLSPAARRALTGRVGPAGPTGPAGSSGAAGVTIRSTTASADWSVDLKRLCNADERAIGGYARYRLHRRCRAPAETGRCVSPRCRRRAGWR